MDTLFLKIKSNHFCSAEEGKVRFLLLQPECHQKVTLVVSRYKVPPVRRISRQNGYFLGIPAPASEKVKVGHEFTQNV